MPKLGLTMSEGTLVEWLVNVGDKIRAGQPIFVVETDKISHDIEATADGELLAQLMAAGETVPVGAVVATWVESGQVILETPPNHPPQAAAPPTTPAKTRTIATPLAKRLAANAGIELSDITLAPEKPRIKARDIEAAIAARTTHAPPPPPSTAPPIPAPGRRLIAARMTRSKQEIPHFYVGLAADIGRLETLRQELNNSGGTHPRLSMTHCLVAAIARALAARPALNALWRDGEITPLTTINVGIAVETPNGVRMPIIPAVDRLPLDDLAAACTAAFDRARAGRLKPTDATAAAISLSNAGMYGVNWLVPIIDPDQTFIVGAGQDQTLFRPAPDGTPIARRELTLTLAADHRLVDGAAAANLLRAIVEQLQSPLNLLRPVPTP